MLRDTFLGSFANGAIESRIARRLFLAYQVVSGIFFKKCMTKIRLAGPEVLLGDGDLLNLPAEQNKTKRFDISLQ
jgi:hypothetical protein